MRPHPVVEALHVLEYLQRRPLAALEGARVHALRPDGPISDSMAALSQGEEIAPIEGLMPFSLMVRPSRSDTHRDPWSEWCMQPAGGLLRAIAILSASSAGPASMRSDIDC